MALNGPDALPPQRPRCARCGEVIGVYEPLVHVRDSWAHHTSQAAEPGIVIEPGDLYHLECCKRTGMSAEMVAYRPPGHARTRSSPKSS